MKFKNIISCALIFTALFLFNSCEKAYNPYPDFESVPHSFGQFKPGTTTSFVYGNNDSELKGDLQWISIDEKVKVVQMDIFVTWAESYKDLDGIGKTANHGKKLIKTISSPAAARTPNDFSIKAQDVYNAFKDAKYDYKDDKGVRDVFSNPKDPDRSLSNYFTSNDQFTISWALKGDDGRYFDSWSGGICSETTGSNCSLKFGVICVSNLAGVYKSVAIGTSTDDCCPEETTVESEVTLIDLGSGKYEISDFSAGLYKTWYEIYGITDAYVSQTDKTKNKLRGDLLDACNKISGQWAEPFQDSTLPLLKITGVSRPDENTIVYTWVNGYDDKATVTLTKK